MTVQRPPRLPELARSVAEVANGVVAAARSAGREDLATALIEISSRWSEPEVAVTLVGATGSGKTTLLSGLVGTDLSGLRSTGPRAPVLIARSGPTQTVHVHRPDSDEPELLEGLDHALEGDVDSIEVTLTGSLVDPRLALLDAPAALAAALAARSDLVLVTTTAAAPIDAPTLEVVTTLLETTPNVVVVVTCTDRYRGWRQIAADSETPLKERFGLRAPDLVAVSGRLALTAAQLRREADVAADDVDEESGLPELRGRLDALVARSRWARLRNLSHLTATVVDELLGSGGADTETVRPADALAETGALVEAYRRRSTELPLALSDECNRLREGIALEVRRLSADAMTAYESRLAAGEPHTDSLQQLRSDLQAGQVGAGTSVELRVEQLTSWVMNRLDGGDALMDAPFSARDVRAPEQPHRRDMSLALRMAAAIAAGGGGLALLGTLALAGGMSGELRLGLLGFSSMSGSFGTMLSLRHSSGQRTATLGRLEARALVDDWQALVAAELRSQLLDAQRRLEASLRAALADRIADLERQALELRSAVKEPPPSEQLAGWRERLQEFQDAAAEAMRADEASA